MKTVGETEQQTETSTKGIEIKIATRESEEQIISCKKILKGVEYKKRITSAGKQELITMNQELKK
jgi:hypothetical protein